MIIPVDSAADDRLEPYLRVRERDLARRDGCFIVEGRVTVDRLITGSRFETLSLFLADSRVARLAPLLERLNPSVPIYVAPQALMDSIVGFPLHRGVLALARRELETAAGPFLRTLRRPLDDHSPITVLGLIGLSNHDNVGACFRNAAALGASGVLLDQECCDPLYRKAIRVSAGTALALPYCRHGTGGEMIAALSEETFDLWALSPQGGEALETLKPPRRLALLLGAEGPGLPRDLLARTRRVSIPMDGNTDSLNVATAGALALWRVRTARSA